MNRLKLLQSNYLTQLVLMFILGGFSGLVYMMLTPMWWLFFLGIAILIAVFISNRLGFLIILTTLFVFNWLFGVLKVIPKEITWLPDVIVIVMTAKMIYLQAREKCLKSTPIDSVLLLIILLGFISAIYNLISPVTFIFGYRNFFKYVLLFFILINIEQDEKFYRLFLILLFILALTQIPISLIQAIYYGNTGEDIADNVSGTLGRKATGAMAIFMCFSVSMFIGFYIQKRKFIFLIPAALCMVPIILGSGQFGFYIIPLAIIICWIFGNPKTLRNFLKIPIMITTLLMIIWIGIIFHDSLYQGKLLETIKSPSKFYEFNFNFRKEGTYGRFQVIKVSNQLLTKNMANFLIGFGPGNASESFFDKYQGKWEKQYQGRKIGGIQFTAIILEFGYLGLLLFLYMFYRLLKMNNFLYHNTKSEFWKSIAIGYNGMVFTYIVGMIYNPVWFYDVLAFTFWFVTAALATQSQKLKESIYHNDFNYKS